MSKKIRPVYQFKRGKTFASLKHPDVADAFKPAVQSSHILPATGSILLQSASSSTSTSSATTPESINDTASVPDDDAIFDFPSALDDFVEIKVMVASNRRTVPHVPKLTRKRSKPKKNAALVNPAKHKTQEAAAAAATTAAITTSSKPKSPVNHHGKRSPNMLLQPKESVASSSHALPCDDLGEFDIFAFDPQPTSHLTHKRKPKPTTATPTRFEPATHYTANTYIPPMPAYHHNHNHHHPISIASLLNEPSPLQPHSPRPVEKKRKRNLVAHLKTASGEKENKHLLHQEFDCLSDEDDLALEQQQQQKSPTLPLKTLIKDPSLSPELTYHETMQMQLDSLMQTEFGQLPQPQPQPQQVAPTTRRPLYQPSNKLNVRVTFQKKQ
ncbi:unnamed protein product [Mucor fragilis]